MNNDASARIQVLASRIPMAASASYPEALRQVVRWNTLVGRGGADWQGIPNGDVRMGLLDLDPGGNYPLHLHPAPEIYFVVSGSAEWTVGDETFSAVPGMAIYHGPDIPHRMVNTGSVPLHTVWFWWAPGGNASVLDIGPRLL